MLLGVLVLVIAVVEQVVLAHGHQPLVDTHHHFVPDFYAEAVAAAGGDPSGWPVPQWQLNDTEAVMTILNTTVTILSLTSPGAPIAKDDVAARALARRANDFCAQIRDAQPQKFGFWAAMPNLLDTNGTIDEIQYALDVLKADGVTLFTRYGNGSYYLGHPEFEPIWRELDRRGAVVFVHPSAPVDPGRANPLLLQPTIDYPHETTRTALDMILSGTRRAFPNTKVILSHAGGNLPWLFSRFALWREGLSVDLIRDNLTYEDALADFRSFHYDLALSSSPEKLDLLLNLLPSDRFLYGSDFPYAPVSGMVAFRNALENYPLSPELKRAIYYENIYKLIPRLTKNAH